MPMEGQLGALHDAGCLGALQGVQGGGHGLANVPCSVRFRIGLTVATTAGTGMLAESSRDSRLRLAAQRPQGGPEGTPQLSMKLTGRCSVEGREHWTTAEERAGEKFGRGSWREHRLRARTVPTPETRPDDVCADAETVCGARSIRCCKLEAMYTPRVLFYTSFIGNSGLLVGDGDAAAGFGWGGKMCSRYVQIPTESEAAKGIGE